MLSSNEPHGVGGDPLAPVEQLTRWLLDATSHVALGLVVGAIVARLMRSRHVHWSWAAAGVALAALLRPALVSPTSTLAVAAVSATALSRRWHREDIEAGSDLAELAAGRRGPLDALRCCAARVASLHGGVQGVGGWSRGEELILGRDEHSRAVSIPFGSGTGGAHTLVVGATGSGKTVTQSWIAARAIERGMGAVVVDPKGDPGLREEVRRAARDAGRAFLEWTPGGPSVYNPYLRGSETEIADKALAGERFSEPHYMRQAQRYLGHVVRALRRSGREVSLRGMVEHMDPARLECLVRTLPEGDAEATHAYLDSFTGRQHSDLAGVRDRLAILAESDVGRWLDPQTAAAERFDLLDAVRARAVVYFDLESDSRPLLMQMLGAAIVQDLQATVAALQRRPTPTLVLIDEFSAVAAGHVVRLFGRARSAGFSLLLCTQELSDLRLPGHERLLEQVMGNLSVVIAHRQVVPASAGLIASLAGTRGAWRTSHRSDGGTTRSRGREGVLDPDAIVGLRVGWAAVIVLARGGGVRFARVFSPRRR
jgi:TraM recognition site of TraD and TraG/Helicase HerA, central domain